MCALLLTVTIHAQSVAPTPRGIVVAHDGAIELYDARDAHRIWRAAGVDNPTVIAISSDKAAVIDPLSNEVAIADLATGKSTLIKANETPVAAVYLGGQLYLLERDARALERIGPDGARASVAVSADPAFLSAANGRLYVYSRAAGVLQEITTSPFAIRRSLRVAPFASDLQVDARNAYLVDPRGGAIRIIDLVSLSARGEEKVGAVPVALALTSGTTALNARTLAVADPSAKRIWMIEGAQSFGQSVARGFLRSLLGLGLYANRNSQFPTGVDRVMVRGSRWLAFDSATGTLYRFSRSKSTPIAKSLGPNAFAVTERGIAWWDGRLHFAR